MRRSSEAINMLYAEIEALREVRDKQLWEIDRVRSIADARISERFAWQRCAMRLAGNLERIIGHETEPCQLDHHGYCQAHPGGLTTEFHCATKEGLEALLLFEQLSVS